MAQLFSNAARGALVSAIVAADNTLPMAASDAALFPTPGGSDFFKVVIQDATKFEIAYVQTNPGTGTLTNVLRGQEGTTAANFAAGSVVGVRLTAADFANLLADLATRPRLTSAQTWTAHQTFGTAGFPAQYNNGNSGTAKTIAFSAGQKQKVTLTGNCTFALTFPGVGNYQLILRQDATGNRTVTWPAGTLYVGGATAPAINTAANGETIVSIYFDGSATYLAASKVGA